MEIEPDSPTSAPPHLASSPFGVEELEKLEELMNELDLEIL